MRGFRLIYLSLLSVVATQGLVSCASEEPKRRERVAPTADGSTLPWNRPPKWEGNSRYGSMMPSSR
ncbi:MAG TPA: hypothetical protein VD994_02005 [Prosthecobacter sp.]|nr:hypothetical protein [Prosthecobacter sp.]